ncbi:MAG TPA: hypothetical protein VNT26_10830 [Candidatus Sulfotelmatobacter sp.]|nr:hypothetical protein [Candidatus Sulfotelmatobacter sp.]
MDLVDAVLDVVAPDSNKLHPRAYVVIPRARKRCQEARASLYGGSGAFQVSPRQFRHYRKTLARVIAAIQEEWPGVLDASEFLVAVVQLLEWAHEQHGQECPAWSELTTDMHEVYSLYDPEYQQDSTKAERFAARLQAIFQGENA